MPQGPQGPQALMDLNRDRVQVTGPFSRLREIYAAMPPTRCSRQGSCCSLLPQTSPVEILAWLDRFQSLPPEDRAREASALMEHFLTNAALRRPCPWARPGACSIYEHRFFPCRAYGLWPGDFYASRREAARLAQEEAVRAWKGVGVELPAQVLEPGPEYCRAVEPLGPAPDASFWEQWEEELYGLGRGLASWDGATGWGGDISFALADMALGRRRALEAKVRVTRELVAGGDGQDILAECREMAMGLAVDGFVS